MKQHSCHFVISGEFLTDISRQMWAEGRPEAGLRILESAFPDMPAELRVGVAMGVKKLEGDSDSGITVHDDEAAMEPSALLQAVLDPYRREIEKLQDEVQFFSGQTVMISSPNGAIYVPERRTKWGNRYGASIRVLDGDWDLLDHIPWKKAFSDAYWERGPSQKKQVEPEPEPEPVPDPPPLGHLSITADNGWLSPEGLFYECLYGGHITLAERLGEDKGWMAIKLEDKGWMKIQDGKAWSLYSARAPSLEPTQKQIDKVFDWYTSRGRELPYWMSPDGEGEA